jgi:hypothetical protein
MTTRRFNFTGAKKIKQNDVDILLGREDGALTFDSSYSLASYELPETAEVVIEAYVEWTLMRFPFGTVGMKHVPQSLSLTEFDDPDGVRFRLKVLGTGDQAGLILAEADKISPSDLTEREHARSFIAVRPSDLGYVAWRLTFDESQPVLQINSRLGDWQSFLRRSPVRALLMPEIVRQVLREAVSFEGDEEDQGAWQHHAMRLASMSSGAPPKIDDEEDIERWVDEVVRKFAQRHRLWRGMSDFIDEETAE